jgi:nicotinamidase-related amidase
VGRQTAPYASDSVVKNTAAIAEAFRKNGMPVFLARVAPSPDGKDALRPIVDAPWPAQTPPPGWADIVPELGPKPGDFVITKHQWGAFYGTELDLQLRRRGMATIVMCGIATNIGVESTARFAYEYGYNQIFAEDAMSALSLEGIRLTQHVRLQARYVAPGVQGLASRKNKLPVGGVMVMRFVPLAVVME